MGPRTLVVCARRCPTLPLPGGGSTIGAGGLSFRVRNGCRAWHPRYDRRDVSMSATAATGVAWCACCGWALRPPAWGGWGLVVDRIVGALVVCVGFPPARCPRVGGCVVCVGRLVPVSSRPLPVFHFWPINPVVCWGPTKKDKSFLRRPYLEDGFPLRCFQRLPFPNVANQPCPGRDNWHTRGSSVPVLSY